MVFLYMAPETEKAKGCRDSSLCKRAILTSRTPLRHGTGWGAAQGMQHHSCTRVVVEPGLEVISLSVNGTRSHCLAA